tara:strand:- start:20587 stop:21186 length:600 start_codon:yes stop_codon:yes gene_type:complete
MESKLKPHDIKEVLSNQQTDAFAKLRLRQQAEYIAKGIQVGEDQELDQKFDLQRQDLYEGIQKREQWIKELEATDNYDQISNELSQDDPYGLMEYAEGKERPLEPDAQSDYFKGFTQGYKLQELAPEINHVLINSGDRNDERMKGMIEARNQHTKDKALDPSSEISPEIWDELDTNKREIESGRSPSKEVDKGKDIDRS